MSLIRDIQINQILKLDLDDRSKKLLEFIEGINKQFIIYYYNKTFLFTIGKFIYIRIENNGDVSYSTSLLWLIKDSANIGNDDFQLISIVEFSILSYKDHFINLLENKHQKEDLSKILSNKINIIKTEPIIFIPIERIIFDDKIL